MALMAKSQAALRALERGIKSAEVALHHMREHVTSLKPRPHGREVFDRAFQSAIPEDATDSETITVAEAAKILGVSEETVRRRLRTSQLVGIAYGGRTGYRLSRAYVEDKAQRVQGATSQERAVHPVHPVA